MRVCLKPVVLGLLLMLSSPIRADAGLAAFLDYLDNLSGPGSFAGPGFEVSLLCNLESTKVDWCPFPGFRDSSVRVYPRFDIGLHLSRMDGRVNDDLPYPDGTPPDDKDVNVTTYGGHATVEFSGIDALRGTTLGATLRLTAYRFSGPLVSDADLTRATMAIGPIVRLPLPSKSLRLYFAPLMVVGLGQFAKRDFGVDDGSLFSDNVKFALHAGIGF